MNSIRSSIALIGLSLLLACGGGGGGVFQKIEGRWIGTLGLVVNQCGIEAEALAEEHQISRDGDNVSIITSRGRTLLGQMLSDDTFEVEIRAGSDTFVVENITYSSIDDGRAQVELNRIFSGPNGCSATWSGEMVQQ